MKEGDLLKTDFSLKYIFFKDEEREYCVMFKSGFLRGVHGVKVRRWDSGKFVHEVGETYPNLIERIKARIVFFKAKVKLLQR